MARFLVGAAIGALVTLVAGAALGIHAQDEEGTNVVADPTDAVLDCIQWAESRDDPGANPRSGAQGLFQFLPSTWRGTPQGRAGLSPFDPVGGACGSSVDARRRPRPRVRYLLGLP